MSDEPVLSRQAALRTAAYVQNAQGDIVGGPSQPVEEPTNYWPYIFVAVGAFFVGSYRRSAFEGPGLMLSDVKMAARGRYTPQEDTSRFTNR